MAKSQSPISFLPTVTGALGGVGINAVVSAFIPGVKLTPVTMGGSALAGGIGGNLGNWLFNKPAPATVGERIINGLTTAGQVAMATTAVIGAVGTVATVGTQLVQLVRAIRAGDEVQTAPEQERASA